MALLCCVALTTVASGTDSLFQRHQISLSMSNGMSQTFFDDPGHKPTAVINQSFGNISWYGATYRATYIPLYATHLQLHYSLGLTPALRIETGVGYLLSSYLQREHDVISGELYYEKLNYNNYVFTGSITLPLYVKYTKAMGHGALTCTAGPDFTLPVHTISHNIDRTMNSENPPDINQHSRLSTSTTGQLSTMGLYLKLGYEKKIRNNLSVNVGPAIDFYQLVQFHNHDWGQQYASTTYHPYQYYLGLDVAVNFGMK